MAGVAVLVTSIVRRNFTPDLKIKVDQVEIGILTAGEAARVVPALRPLLKVPDIR